MQSLQVLDSSLPYQSLEPLDSSSSISSQWSSSFSPLGSPPAPESCNHETYIPVGIGIPIPRDYSYLEPGTKLPPQRPCETNFACPPYNNFHYNMAHYNTGYNQAYPLNMYPSPPMTEMAGSPRTDPNMHEQCAPNHGGFYPRNETELGVSVSASVGLDSFPARFRKKPRENQSRWSSSTSIKSEFFNLDSQAGVGAGNNTRGNEGELRKWREEDLPMGSFREALSMVEPKKQGSKLSSSSDPLFRGSCHIPVLPPETVGAMGLGLTRSKQEEVLKAAKSLFSKRTRTLYQWLCPDASKTKLKASVTAAWDTLSEPEKHFYISQVLGRFGLQESSLMVNPQLDGIKGLPGENMQLSVQASICKARAAIEDQEAVNALFESCDDSHNWTSFRKQKKPRGPRKTALKHAHAPAPPEKEIRKKRKYTRRNPVALALAASARGSKRQSKARAFPENNVGHCVVSAPSVTIVNEDDGVLAGVMPADEEFWNNPLNPAELFPEINF